MLFRWYMLDPLSVYSEKLINMHPTHLWLLTGHNTILYESGKGEESKELSENTGSWVFSESSSSWILPPSSTESRHKEHEYSWRHSSPSPTPPQTVWEDSSMSSPHFRNLLRSRLELKEYEAPHYNPSLEKRLLEGRQIQVEIVWFPEPFIH